MSPITGKQGLSPGARREALLQALWEAQDEAYALMAKYDALPHAYGEATLYQAEGLVIHRIGRQPGITISELSRLLDKTVSACSQIVGKLRDKGWVIAQRDPANSRRINLRLTEAGRQVYLDRLRFNRECQAVTFGMLQDFSDEALACHLAVQQALNEAYRGDILRGGQ